jgi:glycosyltransferase involved in cell wall biosynthesis
MNNSTTVSGAPRVTIVVVPRERFGVAQRSLESIYATAGIPFELIYIDARSPRKISEWLKAESADKGFRVIHLDRFVNPNEARNIGLAASSTEYVVFSDNDIICADGWLSAAVRCADETGADVVQPLICEGLPVHSRVHFAKGAFAVDKKTFFSSGPGDRDLLDVMTHHREPIEKVRDVLKREQTETCEFHCILMRRSIFDRTGPFDEDMGATKDHIDFSICVAQVGGKIVFEPNSLITYVFPSRVNPITKEDSSYFLLRWSPQWQLHSLRHMQAKWGLKWDGEELGHVSQPEYLRMRQYEGYIKPIIRKIPVVRDSYRLARVARRILEGYVDRRVRRLAAEYDKQRAAGWSGVTK